MSTIFLLVCPITFKLLGERNWREDEWRGEFDQSDSILFVCQWRENFSSSNWIIVYNSHEFFIEFPAAHRYPWCNAQSKFALSRAPRSQHSRICYWSLTLTLHLSCEYPKIISKPAVGLRWAFLLKLSADHCLKLFAVLTHWNLRLSRSKNKAFHGQEITLMCRHYLFLCQNLAIAKDKVSVESETNKYLTILSEINRSSGKLVTCQGEQAVIR